MTELFTELWAGVAQLIASDLEVDSWVSIPRGSSEFPVCCYLQTVFSSVGTLPLACSCHLSSLPRLQMRVVLKIPVLRLDTL